MKSSPIPIVFRQLSRATPTTPRFTSIAPRSFPRPASSSTTPQSRLTTDPQRPPTHASKYFKTPKPAPSPTSTQDPAAKASAPPDETPAQKVARLRAARNAQKAAQFSLWDRTVVRGREIVDRIHRWFVKGIIGATVIIALVSVVETTRMVLYNRRKRDVWYKDQLNAYHAALEEAISRSQQGLSLDEDQILLLNNLKAKHAANARREREGGIIKKSWKGVVDLAGWKTAEEGAQTSQGEEDIDDEDAPTGPMGVMVEMGRRERGEANEFEILKRIQERKMMSKEEQGIAGETPMMSAAGKIERENMGELVPDVAARVKGSERIGGPLDQMAERIVEDGRRSASSLIRGKER